MILITVLFAPTSLHLTTDSPSLASNLVERDAHGRMTRINLPDRLVIMANHQCYTDWMYMWILACYAGHAEGLTILLKWSLRHVPFVGWGMVSYLHGAECPSGARVRADSTALLPLHIPEALMGSRPNKPH